MNTVSKGFVITVMCLISGCQTLKAATPARLASIDQGSISSLRATLSKVLNRAQFEFGPDDLATSSSFTVLPPPLGQHETHSMATPVRFDIVIEGHRCLIVRHDTGVSYELKGVKCVEINPQK